MLHALWTYELSPLYFAQAALTIWMLVDANRRGAETYWFYIILWFQPLGAWAYFFTHKIRDFTGWRPGSATAHTPNWLTNLFTRRASVEELRYRVDQSPTMAARLELALRLVELHEYSEAEPHLQAVLAREPDHHTALFTLAECYRNLDRPVEAIPLLQKLVLRQSGWRNGIAWYSLIQACQQAGNHTEAVAQARRLAQVTPSLEHKCLLANSLDEAGDRPGALEVVEKALEEFRFNPNPPRSDRRWVGKAKQLLKELQRPT